MFVGFKLTKVYATCRITLVFAPAIPRHSVNSWWHRFIYQSDDMLTQHIVDLYLDPGGFWQLILNCSRRIEGIWVDLSFQSPHGFKNQAGKVSGYSGSITLKS